MSLKIYSYPNSYRVWKSLIAGKYNQVEIELPAFDFATDRLTPEFKAKNPLGKVPVLETAHGCIYESNAMARYVARLRADSGLYGNSYFESGLVDQWLDFSSFELEACRNIWLYPVMEITEFNPKAYAEAKKDVANCMTVLNNHLERNTFLVGNQVTLADIVLVSALVDLYRLVFDAKFIAPFGNVTRWFTTCINQCQFAEVIGKVEFAKSEKMAPKPKKEKKEKGAKPPATAAAPKEAKKAAPKPEVTDEEPEKPKEKPKNPLDMLPESSMSLDASKKLFFSQRPFLKTFWTEFWPQFDAAGFSFYVYNYKYDNENTVLFMTGNVLAGFLQRLEKARKYAFGCIYISAKDEDTPPYHIGGAFLFRGQDVPFEVVDAGDAEYYNWEKVDTSKPENRAMLEAEFCADAIKGVSVLDRRYFK